MSEWLSLCVAIFITASLLLVAALCGRYCPGLLSHITVMAGSPPLKKITFAYKLNEGPSKTCATNILKESRSIGPNLPCVCIFYDDPQKVTRTQCRCAIGSILSEGENKADEELLKRYQESGFSVFSFPEVTHVVATATSLPDGLFFSFLLRVKRVYPQLERYIKERRLCAHPFLEIYREGQVQFMAPLARQGDFYVPESRQVEKRLSEDDEQQSDTDISGADSNSEYSSGSGVLLSDSRETSPAASSVHSPDRRGSGGSSCKDESDWTPAGGQLEEREKTLDGDSVQKSLEAPAQEWWGVVGGEE